MNYILEKIKLNIVKEINRKLNKDLIKPEDLVSPPNLEMGDLSLACFALAKNTGKNPAELASFLASELKDILSKEVSFLKATGPYLNFILDKDYLAKNVIGEIEKNKNKYGTNKSGKNKRVMIEYSNANTHKEYHVGHLRNICYGDAVAKILAANGYKVIPVSYINDFGVHVAKTLWAYEIFFKKEKLPADKGYFLGQVYVRATEELEKDKMGKQMVALMMKKIESRHGEEYKLWQKTRKWSIEYMDGIYKELGVKFSHIFYESEVIDKGKKIIDDLLKKGFLIKSEGAVIVDLNQYNLGVLVFIRSDGTALYPTADIPLAHEKFKKYKLDKSIYVVDIRQGLYFKQLFKLMELLGYKKEEIGSPIGGPISSKSEMVHLGYEFVKLPDGVMSSRTGNVITYEDLRTKLTERAAVETKKRHEDWGEKKTKEVAGKLVNGAMKFEMIKVSREQVITFDINQALRFDGFTAAYLQYTCARIKSIIKKSKIKNQKSKLQFKVRNLEFREKEEHNLIIKLAKYPEAVERAGENYNPAEIAKYLFELAQKFNNYYHKIPILKAEAKTRQVRLALINTVSQVIANGLGLLGIEAVEEM